MAAAVEHVLELPDGGAASTDGDEDQVHTSVVADLAPGQRVGFVKYVCHIRSLHDPSADLGEQVLAALAGARERGWDGLLADQRGALDAFWADADVAVDGDPDGGPLRVRVDGATVTVAPGRPATVPLTVVHPSTPTPRQPPGREPTA